MTTYNGWTNYATWRVNLEIFDCMEPRDIGGKGMDKFDLADCLKEYANEAIETGCDNGLALDYARAFLSDVNWQEIAQSMIEAYPEEEEEEEDEEVAA